MMARPHGRYTPIPPIVGPPYLTSSPPLARATREDSGCVTIDKTSKLGDTKIGRHRNWATPQLGDTAIGRHQNWATPKLGDTKTGGRQNWGTPKLGDAKTGGHQNWGTPKLGDTKTGGRQNWATPQDWRKKPGAPPAGRPQKGWASKHTSMLNSRWMMDCRLTAYDCHIEMFCSRVIEVTLILPATSVSMNADIASSYSPVPE